MRIGDVRDSWAALTYRFRRERRGDALARVLMLLLVTAEDRPRRCHRQDAAARLTGVGALWVGLEQALQLARVGYDYERAGYHRLKLKTVPKRDRARVSAPSGSR
jgi:hypothetical protein